MMPGEVVAKGVPLTEASTEDTESLNFSPEEARELAVTARQIIEERDRALEERDRALAERDAAIDRGWAAARRRVRVQLWALDCARAHVHGPGSVGRYFRAVVRQARVRELLRGLR